MRSDKCDGVDGPDSDGDGFADINTGGDDCDDGNFNIDPMALGFRATGSTKIVMA